MKTEGTERVVRALETIRSGGMVILMDDEDRENEGDLVMAAEHATPESINFMARHARGLICLSLTEERIAALGLPMMVDENQSSRSTAFTVSIEAAEGVSTGISAADRALTIRTAVAPDAKAGDIVSPGHVFPLKAKRGGVLRRTGHTEGATDLARLAGCDPSGVICEIMKDDGTMARRPDLEVFAQEHGLMVLTIADLIEYRLQTETLVRCVDSGEVTFASGGTWTAHVYESDAESRQYLALQFGAIDSGPTLVRVHTGSVLGDVFGVRAPQRVGIDEAIDAIERDGKGVVLFLPGKVDLEADLKFHLGTPGPRSGGDAGAVLREFGLGAQVLADLGLAKIRLLTNRPRRIVGLEGYGLEVVEQQLLREDALHEIPQTTH